MKSRDQDVNLNKLPQRRSPKALDDTILAYARQEAPKRTHNTANWMRGLALASVAVITVLVVLPQRPPTLTESDMASEASARLAEHHDERKETGMAAPSATNPATKPKQEPMRLQEQRFSRQDAIALKSKTHAKRLHDDVVEQNTATFIGSLKQQAAEPEISVQAEFSLTSNTPEIKRELERIQTWLDAGQDQAAVEAWHALQKRCQDCEWPTAIIDAMNRAIHRSAASQSNETNASQ